MGRLLLEAGVLAELVLVLPPHIPMDKKGRNGTNPERGLGGYHRGPENPNKARSKDLLVTVAPTGINTSCP